MMILFSRWMAALSLCAVVHAADPQPAGKPRPDDGGLQQWRSREGKVIDAFFTGLDRENQKVHVIGELGPVSIPFDRLTPESLKQAGKLSAIIGVFKPVRDGRFDMGSPPDEPGRDTDEPQREVLTAPFVMKITEVTWAEWNAVRRFAELNEFIDIKPGTNGAQGADADLNPVVGVTWWDAVKWCNLRSILENRKPVYHTAQRPFKPTTVFKNGTAEIYVDWSADGYRLPTEAEWEFACRTRRTKAAFHTGSIQHAGDGKDFNLDNAGWYVFNSDGGPRPVALKRPNQFGFYDMHGNAAEWCWDCYQVRPPDNPRALWRGDKRVVRGGSWNAPAAACRSAARDSHTPGATPDRLIGFRPVRAR